MSDDLSRTSPLDEVRQLGLLGGKIVEALRLEVEATGRPASEVLAETGGEKLSPRMAAAVAFLKSREADASRAQDQRAMTLQAWLPASGFTIETFAEVVGIHYSTASEIYRGRRWPDSNTILAIQRVSGGAVSYWDAEYFRQNRRVTTWMRQRGKTKAA